MREFKMDKAKLTIAAVLVVIVLAGAAFAGFYVSSQGQSTKSMQTPEATQTASPQSAPVPVVAAENFWGSLISQLGGSRAQVLSIVTDPNADPTNTRAIVRTRRQSRTQPL